MTTVTLNINGIELIEKVNTEINSTYDTCVTWIDTYAEMTTDSRVFREKSEHEISEFAFYCDGLIRTLEMMNIDVREQRKLIGNLKERAENHILKYM